MNYKIKKTFLLIVLLLSIVVLSACGEAKLPELSKPDEQFFTAKQGSSTFSITNKEIYDILKKQVGSNVLLDQVDLQILKTIKKDSKSYYESVAETEIEKDIEEAIFPNGREDLTKEKIDEAIEKFYNDSFVQYGLNTEKEVKDYYRLNLAKKSYARDQLVLDYQKEDIKQSEIESYYKSNYRNEYYAIIFSYPSKASYDEALAQLNLKIENNVWKTSSGTVLDNEAIVKAYIDLYNMNNAHKVPNYPIQQLLLNEGTEYKIENNKTAFDLTEIDELHYTYQEIRAYQTQIQTELEKMDAYGKGNNFYRTAIDYGKGIYQFYLKVDQKNAPALNDVSSEIREKLIENKLTDSVIQEKLAKLRADSELVIYDKNLESAYVNAVASYKITHKETKKLKGQVVAATKYGEITSDDFFDVLVNSYGLSLTAYELEYLMLLKNPDFNKIYKFDKSLKEADRIIDQTKYTAIKNEIKDIKNNFNNDMYKEYGFDKNYGWENFLKDAYGVSSEEDMIYQNVFSSIKETYGKSLGDIDKNWDFYDKHMKENLAKYFSVEGIHLLIYVNNESNSPLDPKEWTETQKTYAQSLYKEVMDYLKTGLGEKETYESRLTKIVEAFNKAPRFVPGRPLESQPEGFNYSVVYNGVTLNLSKYKSAGLVLKFENLGTFTNGQMVEAFNDAVKSMWDKDTDSETPTVYGIDKTTYPEIVTNFGYHVYVNLKSNPVAEWKTGSVLPIIEDIKKYEANSSDKNLTTKIKTAITTYYSPIKQELIGTNNTSININNMLLDLELTLNHKNISLASFTRYLNLANENLTSKLTFK